MRRKGPFVLGRYYLDRVTARHSMSTKSACAKSLANVISGSYYIFGRTKIVIPARSLIVESPFIGSIPFARIYT